MTTKELLIWALVACFFGFAVFKAYRAVRMAMSSNAPALTKLLLIIVSIVTCLSPWFWGEAERLVDDHLKKKGYRRKNEVFNHLGW